MHLPQPGEQFLGRFEVHEEIGSGGFARVYRATDPAGRQVALKVLLPDADNTYSREVTGRFGRESRALSALRDPHTVMMLDSGVAPSGLLYMVFELVPGRDLAELLKERGKLDTRLAIHILRQVLLSLREAHAMGLLHRDIKPDNIRVFEYGGDPYCAKLLDFGIARHMSGSEHTKITQTGHLVGTPRYMSPEQLLDRPLGPSSDIYSVGLVMLECVAGRDALHGNEWSDQLQRLHTGQLAGIPQLQHVSPEFVQVLHRMTEREQAYRFQSVEAVLRALDNMGRPATGGHTLSGVRSNVTQAPQKERSSTRMLVILAAVALLLMGVAAVLLVKHSSETPETVTIVRRPPSTVASPAKPAEKEPKVVENEPIEEPELTASTDGCGADRVRKGMSDGSIIMGLSTLDYVTYVPPTYTSQEKVPLLILLHPDHIQPDAFLRDTRFDLLADKKGFIVLAPTVGERDAWTEGEHIDRVAFLVEEVLSQYCIDQERIFAVGHNNAGKGVQRLSCRPFIAAGATNSFRPRDGERWCASDPPKPMLTLNPLKTGHMHVDGGVNCYGSKKISLKDFETYWKERNHCTGKPKPYFEHGESSCSSWTCDEVFVSCHIDGGLGWPGSAVRVLADFNRCDGEPPDFPTEDVIWKFFEEVKPAQ